MADGDSGDRVFFQYPCRQRHLRLHRPIRREYAGTGSRVPAASDRSDAVRPGQYTVTLHRSRQLRGARRRRCGHAAGAFSLRRHDRVPRHRVLDRRAGRGRRSVHVAPSRYQDVFTSGRRSDHGHRTGVNDDPTRAAMTNGINAGCSISTRRSAIFSTCARRSARDWRRSRSRSIATARLH